MNITEALKECMKAGEERLVHFQYTDAKGKQTNRDVEPYEVKNGRLFGWCMARNEIRQFILDSIDNPSVGAPFKPRMPVIPFGKVG